MEPSTERISHCGLVFTQRMLERAREGVVEYKIREKGQWGMASLRRFMLGATPTAAEHNLPVVLSLKWFYQRIVAYRDARTAGARVTALVRIARNTRRQLIEGKDRGMIEVQADRSDVRTASYTVMLNSLTGLVIHECYEVERLIHELETRGDTIRIGRDRDTLCGLFITRQVLYEQYFKLTGVRR